MKLPKPLLRDKLLKLLEEDVGMGDLTTEAIVPTGVRVSAHIIAKEPCVVAGLEEVKTLFEMLGVETVRSVNDGEEVSSGTVIAEVVGEARAILAAERTALNLLMRMSGIATATRKLLKKLEGKNTRVAATRKTAPGLRYFDKKAVAMGGGDTHRLRLDDTFLIKDNHIVVAGGVENAVKKALSAASFTKKIEVEVKRPEEVLKVAQLGVDVIMLDNMSLDEVEESLRILKENDLRDKVVVEVSGNITEDNIAKYAMLGVDVISLGALTHSVKAVDRSLEIMRVL